MPNSRSDVDLSVSTTGVMLVGHGTRDDEGTQQFFQLGDLLAQKLASVPVQSCLLEFQHPTIPEAWETLAESGATHIHVAPLLLFAAGHAKSDIPDCVGQCQTATPSITFDQSRPLSRHPAIIELVCRRITETMSAIDTPPDRTALIMVGRGSHDPCAQADMRVLTEVVANQLSISHRFTSFYAMARPRMPEVIDSVASSGNYDTLIVQPHLLFAGRLYQAIQSQVAEAATRHPAVDIRLSNYLGPDPLVAEAIAARVSVPAG